MKVRAFLMIVGALLFLGGCDVPAAQNATGLSQADLDDDVDFDLDGPYETVRRP
jgi:hypothetical protein